MTKFDVSGQSFLLDFNVGMLIEVEQKTGVNLDNLIEEPKTFAKFIYSQPRRFVEMMYVLLEEQLVKKNITPEQFGRMFNRPTLDAATNALLTESILFSQRLPTGQAIRERLPQLLEKMDREISETMGKKIDQALSSTDTSLAESSALTPGPTPSDT